MAGTDRFNPTGALRSALICMLKQDTQGAADGLSTLAGWMLATAREAVTDAKPDLAAMVADTDRERKRADAAEAKATALAAELAKLSGIEPAPTPAEILAGLSQAHATARSLVSYLATVVDPIPDPASLPHTLDLDPSEPPVSEPVEPEPVKPGCGHVLCEIGPCIRPAGHEPGCIEPWDGGSRLGYRVCGCGLLVPREPFEATTCVHGVPLSEDCKESGCRLLPEPVPADRCAVCGETRGARHDCTGKSRDAGNPPRPFNPNPTEKPF